MGVNGDRDISGQEVLLQTLSDNVANLAIEVRKNTEQLSRLAVLEANHNNASQAIDRAFKSIERLEAKLEANEKSRTDLEEKNQVEHRTLEKWIWTVSGAAIAVSILWTVFGAYVNDMIRENQKAVSEFRYHIASDKLVAPEDAVKAFDHQGRDRKQP